MSSNASLLPRPGLGYSGCVTIKAKRLLSFLLVLSILPGWMELLENLEHLVHDGRDGRDGHDGHLAHTSDHHQHDEAHAALEAEHACTPVSHHCGCHTSIPVVLAIESELPERWGEVLRQRPQELIDGPLTRANAPPNSSPQSLDPPRS